MASSSVSDATSISNKVVSTPRSMLTRSQSHFGESEPNQQELPAPVVSSSTAAAAAVSSSDTKNQMVSNDQVVSKDQANTKDHEGTKDQEVQTDAVQPAIPDDSEQTAADPGLRCKQSFTCGCMICTDPARARKEIEERQRRPPVPCCCTEDQKAMDLSARSSSSTSAPGTGVLTVPKVIVLKKKPGSRSNEGTYQLVKEADAPPCKQPRFKVSFNEGTSPSSQPSSPDGDVRILHVVNPKQVAVPTASTASTGTKRKTELPADSAETVPKKYARVPSIAPPISEDQIVLVAESARRRKTIVKNGMPWTADDFTPAEKGFWCGPRDIVDSRGKLILTLRSCQWNNCTVSMKGQDAMFQHVIEAHYPVRFMECGSCDMSVPESQFPQHQKKHLLNKMAKINGFLVL